jgi:hypothetical protein
MLQMNKLIKLLAIGVAFAAGLVGISWFAPTVQAGMQFN